MKYVLIYACNCKFAGKQCGVVVEHELSHTVSVPNQELSDFERLLRKYELQFTTV